MLDLLNRSALELLNLSALKLFAHFMSSQDTFTWILGRFQRCRTVCPGSSYRVSHYTSHRALFLTTQHPASTRPPQDPDQILRRLLHLPFLSKTPTVSGPESTDHLHQDLAEAGRVTHRSPNSSVAFLPGHGKAEEILVVGGVAGRVVALAADARDFFGPNGRLQRSRSGSTGAGRLGILLNRKLYRSIIESTLYEGLGVY